MEPNEKFEENCDKIIQKAFRIEHECQPTSICAYPASKELMVLVTTEDHKMKLWNPEAQGCRKTCLGPNFGCILSTDVLQTTRGDDKENM